MRSRRGALDVQALAAPGCRVSLGLLERRLAFRPPFESPVERAVARGLHCIPAPGRSGPTPRAGAQSTFVDH